jgi:hypothetical protein
MHHFGFLRIALIFLTAHDCLTEVYAGSIVLCNMIYGTVERAILETLAYSDIFDYPLRLEEIHHYLPVRATTEELSDALSVSKQVGMKNDFCFLAGRDDIVDVRNEREMHSRKLLPYARRYGRLIGILPFVRMVALTGSLAVLNSSGDADFDYMLVAAPRRVWTARAFTLLLNRFTRRLGHTLCPNIIISEEALSWSTRDLYTARELCQMIPITGADVYQKLMKHNEWVREFLPNAWQTSAAPKRGEASEFLKRLIELPLRGKLCNRFENWEMTRKIVRFSRQQGFGEETIFNAEMCQGNFDHHSKRTRDLLDQKIKGFNSPLPEGEGLEVRKI